MNNFFHAICRYLQFTFMKTVRKLTIEEKNKYHRENSLAAEMVLVDVTEMPKTHDALKEWVIEKSRRELLSKNRCCYGCL